MGIHDQSLGSSTAAAAWATVGVWVCHGSGAFAGPCLAAGIQVFHHTPPPLGHSHTSPHVPTSVRSLMLLRSHQCSHAVFVPVETIHLGRWLSGALHVVRGGELSRLALIKYREKGEGGHEADGGSVQ
mmetsp:Transcript_27946/g.71824  ORF Transcript_27946/g.71824 Transcript_27946/m.71824 type:complete len:128 (+) Transcript_27946:1584-1967(+)